MTKKAKKLPRYASAMKGQELWSKLQKIGFTQVGFARKLGVSDTTVRAWISEAYPVPLTVAYLVNLMIEAKTEPDELSA
jgi:DNA-binding transcriptional regulator YiaG